MREDVGGLHSLPKFEVPCYVQVDMPPGVEVVRLAGMVGGFHLLSRPDSERCTEREQRSRRPIYRYARDTKQNIPEGEIALKEGAWVISADYHHVGHIESVVVDSQTDQVTDVVIANNALLTTIRKRVPVSWIEAVYENRVYLTVEAAALKDVPERI